MVTYGAYTPKRGPFLRKVCFSPHLPRSTCTATHADPVELPKCHDRTPVYLRDIIRDCRLPDPQSRVSTSDLAHLLRSTPQPIITPAEIQQALMPYVNSEIGFVHAVYCDECGNLATEVHFHCNLCASGNYDICPACFEIGSRCLVPEHRLVKTARSKTDIVDISQ